MDFAVGICGSGDLPKEMYEKEAHLLLERLVQKPVKLEDFPENILKAFKDTGAIRVVGNDAVLNCNCFVKSDFDFLHIHGEKFGHSLFEKVKDAVSEQLKHNDCDIQKKILFFIVGCVVLDWGGLKVLDNNGFSLTRDEIKKPNGDHYTLFITERIPQSKKELYWGSHNSRYNEVCFTTFGDHENKRIVFPDISWHISQLDTKEEMDSVLRNTNKFYLESLANVLKNKAPLDDFIPLLNDLNYFKDGQTNIPVLMESEIKEWTPFIQKLNEILEHWLVDNIEEIKNTFNELTPLKFDVDFREVVIQIWHYIFGYANKELVHADLMFNPYSQESDWEGYLPVIYQTGCGIK